MLKKAEIRCIVMYLYSISAYVFLSLVTPGPGIVGLFGNSGPSTVPDAWEWKEVMMRGRRKWREAVFPD